MKRHATTSIDGFVPRRSGAQLGSLHQASASSVPTPSVQPNRRLDAVGESTRPAVGVPRQDRFIARNSDLDESLREIDDPDLEHGKRDRRFGRHADKVKKPKSRVRRVIKWLLLLLLIAGLAVGGFLAYKAITASNSVFKGSILDLVQNQPLKEDANGRSNFLILGTSEDDPGHEASYLTDSILILSVNQKTKDAYTFSVPRDLYVQYGMACLPGYAGKINSYFSCVNDGTDDAAEQDRLAKTQAFIGDIVGMDIQYGVHVNYTVMRDVVNAIGGTITVNIESRDPMGQMDSNFDWKCGATRAVRIKNCPPNGHFIDYPNGPAVLDAEHALYLAQARGDVAPTYGFEQSNFDRERNQQKILVAIKDKALSSGTLTNLGAITGLIDALGKNLRTNVQTKEVRTIAELAKDIPNNKITSIDLYKDGEAQFTTKTLAGAGSVVLPAAGEYDYTDLQAYLKKNLTASAVVKEDPHVTVLNGGAASGMAQDEADKLSDAGFTVDTVGNAPDGTYPKVTVYQITKTKTASAAKLASLYGVTPVTTTPPVSVDGDTDFVVIIGPSNT